MFPSPFDSFGLPFGLPEQSSLIPSEPEKQLFSLRRSSSGLVLPVLSDLLGVLVAGSEIVGFQRRLDAGKFRNWAFGTAVQLHSDAFLPAEILAGSLLDIHLVFVGEFLD
jgi:hypothetical protein